MILQMHSRYKCKSHCQNQSVLDYDCTMRTFAERLKATREEQELSQVQLALRSGVSQSTIANIESGRNQGSKYILAIARALDVRPQWLENETPPKRLFDSGMNESAAERAAAELIARASSGAGKGSTAVGEDEDTALALKKLFAAYSQGGAAKQEAMLRLAELPEPEMATLLLVIQSIGSKYKR